MAVKCLKTSEKYKEKKMNYHYHHPKKKGPQIFQHRCTCVFPTKLEFYIYGQKVCSGFS